MFGSVGELELLDERKGGWCHPKNQNFLFVGIAAYCYMTKIFVFLWEFFFFFLKVGVGYYSCLRFLIGV